MSRRLGAVVAMIWLYGAAAHGFEPVKLAPPQVALPPMAKAPTIDGKIGAEEWGGATCLVGCMKWQSDVFTQRQARLWIGWDDHAVYMAVRSELPPAGTLAAQADASNLSALAIKDDVIEFWLCPYPNDPVGDKPYYQFLLNSAGRMMVNVHYLDPKRKRHRTQAVWQFANGMHDGWWHAEAAFPLTTLGVKTVADGHDWAMRVCRVWRNPFAYSAFGQVRGGFANVKTMMHVRLDRTAPLVRAEQLGDVFDGKVDVKLSVATPSAVKVRTRIVVQPMYDLPEAGHEETFALAAGQRREVAFSRPGYFRRQDKHYALVEVTSADGKQVFYRYPFGWHRRTAERWARELRAAPSTGIGDDVLLHVSFDKGLSPDLARGDKAVRTIKGKPTPTDGKRGRAVTVGGGTQVVFAAPGNIRMDHGTLELWIRPDDWDVKTQGMYDIVMLADPPKPREFWGHGLRVYGPPQRFPVRLAYMAGVGGKVMVFGSRQVAWERGRWRHVAMTWRDGRHVKLYLDGKPLAVGTLHQPLTTSNLGRTLRLGTRRGKRTTSFDELYVYKRVLTDAEIQWAFSSHDLATHSAMGRSLIARHALYPYLHRLDIHLDSAALADAAPRTVTYALLFGDKVIAQGTAKGISRESHTIRIEGLPPLKAGRHVIRVTMGDRTARHEFTRTVYPWEHNTLGLSDKVIPPFTAMQAQGDAVRCVLREYRFDGSGLWTQAFSKGQALLARPMRLRMQQDGRDVALEPGRFAVTSRTETAVRGKGAASGGGVQVRTDVTVEYDGVMKVELALAPQGQPVTVDSLDLEIPMRTDQTTLCHIITDKARGNTSDYLPKGQGVIWRSSQETTTDLLGTFVPYIWVGTPDRGLCWFADNDRGWVTDDKVDALQLIRYGDALTLRVRLIAKRHELRTSRRIVFGVQATPAKPQPANWRRTDMGALDGMAAKYNLTYPFLIPSSYGSGRVTFSWTPLDDDFRVITKIKEMGETGRPDEAFFAAYRKKYDRYKNAIRGLGSRNIKTLDVLFGKMFIYGRWIHQRKPTFFTTYTHMRCLCNHVQPLVDFHSEWQANPGPFRPFDPESDLEIRGTRIGYPPSLVDYYVWANVQMMRAGVGSIYFDVSKLKGSRNRVMSAAYLRPDGKVQPSVDIWGMREAMRRTAVAAHRMGKWGPWIHCTNSVPVPVFGWGFITMDMEGRYGRTDFQTRYPEGYILAQTTGIQCGTVPTALNGIKGPRPRRMWRDEFNRLVRTQFATLIPYEIRIWGASTRRAREAMYTFGYGLDDCRVIRFWDTEKPVTVRGPDHRILVCLRNGKALVIVSDFGGGGRYEMTVDAKGLGVPAGAKAVDAETGEAVPPLGPGRFAFDVAKHDFKVILIR